MKIDRWFRLGLMLVALLGLFAATEARAGAYHKPDLENVFKALVRFGAIDLSDDYILDAYAQVMACDVYNDFYKDEFKWQKIRPIIREQINKELPTYPTGFQYQTTLRLDRYDFNKKFYPFEESSQRHNINVFPISRTLSELCVFTSPTFMPSNYKVVLDTMTNVTGLPLDPDEAKGLVARMDQSGNTGHLVYVRFNIRVKFIAPIDFRAPNNGEKNNHITLRAQVMQSSTHGDIILDSHLDSVEYFEDEGFTKPIYVYRP